MDSYNVLLIIGGAVIFAISVGTPVIKLNTSVAKLITAVDVLQKSVDALTADNKSAHERLWTRADEHGAQLAEHNTRISLLEQHNKAPSGGKGKQ